MRYLMRAVNRLYTQWSEFEGRKSKRLDYEQHVCVYHGKERFRLVSPIFRKNLYVNSFDNYPRGQSPVDFFDVDLKKYPLTTQFDFLEVTLAAGDCIYVPAYYYVQSRTEGEGIASETIMIAEQYESHSRLIDVFMDAIEGEDVTEEEEHQTHTVFDSILGTLGFHSGVNSAE